MEKTKEIEEQILRRAYEIWEYRMANGLHLTMDEVGNPREQTSEDDYFESQSEILGNLNLRR